MDRDVSKFEPNTALNGGIEGLSEIRKVIDKSSELIKKSGKLILEIAFNQNSPVKTRLRVLPLSVVPSLMLCRTNPE